MARKRKQSISVQKKCPLTFFKILVGEFRDKIRLPPYFVKEFEKIIPKEPKLTSHLGKCCAVSVNSDNNGYLFKRGWEKFVEDNDLEEGDLLVFNLVDESTFEVLIHGPSCCLKKIEKGADHQDHETCSPASRNISPKNLGAKPRISSRKTGNAKVKKIRRGRAEEPNSCPHFVVILNKYHKYNLAMPKGFARRTGLAYEKRAVIKDPKGKAWPVGIRVSRINGQVRLGLGWSDFYRANGLTAGDACTFYSLQEDGNLIKVEISKSRDALNS